MLEPGIPLAEPGTQKGPKCQGPDRLDTAERQGGLAHLVQTRHAIDPFVVPRRSVHRDQQVSGSSFQKFVWKRFAFAIFEGKTGQQDPVEKPFINAGIPPHQIG